MNKIKTPCIILCGGKSSRMGEDKSLIKFGDKTLIKYQYDRLKEIFSSVYISSKNVDKYGFDAKFIEDRFDIYAPTVGIYSAFEELDEEFLFFIAVDYPFISKELILELNSLKKDCSIIAADEDKEHYLIGFFHKNIKDIVKKEIDRDFHKIGVILKEAKYEKVSFKNRDIFLNMNNQDEYKIAKEILMEF